MIVSLVAALLVQTAAPAPAPAPTPAPAPAPVCAGIAPPPAGLEAWTTISAITMGPIKLGQGTGVHMAPNDKVVFKLPPERPAKPGTFGGTYSFQIATTGTYRIALKGGAWIDVIGPDGTPLKSVAHAMGPACTGIRKIVDFAFVPGAYTLQLSGAPAEHMRLLIVPK